MKIPLSGRRYWWRGDDGARKLDGLSWWSKMIGQLVNPKRRFWWI
jgi:hypothetical protein